MYERFTTKQEEMSFLAKEYAKNPDLFSQRTFIEDSTVLGEFGIHIPDKEGFPAATLKFWPEDFIVEEIGQQGEVYDISFKELPTTLEPAPTYWATLVKCGMSTLEAIDDLSRALGIPKTAIGYAGIKDKDALTAQRISIRNADPVKLLAFRSPYFFLKDIEGGKGVLDKGHLRGNRFTILVRTTQSLESGPASEHVARALERVHDKGFYNFYYLQRFGTPRLRNFYWAQQIMLGNYKEAVFDFLTYPAPRELDYFKAVRRELKDHFGEWQWMLERTNPFPIILAQERSVLEHLAGHPDDYLGALQTITEQILIWMNALTSFLFNEKISDYIRRHKEPPAMLPLVLSNRSEDWHPYKEMLQSLGLFPLPYKNLRSFPSLQIKSRQSSTTSRVAIRKGEIVKEGLVLQFDLGKGQYATTFLSHVFNLTSGFPPTDISKERIDSKKIIGQGQLQDTISLFEKVIHKKGENVFEQFAEKTEN